MRFPRVLALACAAAFGLGPVALARTKPPVCPGGRFLVQGEDLLPGASLAGPDSLFVGATEVGVASGCADGPVKLKGTKRGTKVRATWESCSGATGKVKLKATIDPTCQTLSGKLTAKKSKLKRTFSATLAVGTVRACDYVPGVSQPAVMPPEVLNPPPPPPPPPIVLPTPTPVPPETTAAQLDVFGGLWNAVSDHYVDPDFNGVDWNAIGDQYQALIEQGLTDADFYLAMGEMVRELGDGHSYFQSPQLAADEDARIAAGQSFVGIGILALPIPGAEEIGAIISIFPGSTAEAAGLRPHDALLEVDGLPYRDEFGIARSLGPAGTSFELTYQRPGETPQTITIMRQAVQGFLPIDRCIVPDTRIGYVLVPTLLDSSIDDQVREALQDMTFDGPLEGLVLDNRMNGGGLGSVAQDLLGLFTSGLQGHYVTRDAEAEPFTITASDAGGSQSLPLVALIDRNTVSYGEIVSGVLQHSDRATLLGGRTAGNVEQLFRYDFANGSRAWLATRSFAPNGLPPGFWEGTGVLPDVSVPTRWDLFSEATDPALAEAVELLLAP